MAAVPYMDFLPPAFGGKPFFPPALAFSKFALLLVAEFWSRLRDRPQGIKSDRRSQGIDVLGFSQLPGTNQTVVGIIHPLRTEALWTALLHGNPVFQIRGMPGRDCSMAAATCNRERAIRWNSGSPIACCAMSHAASLPSLPTMSSTGQPCSEMRARKRAHS